MSTSTQAVFLSYASQDAPIARRVCDALRAAGLEVWFDQSALRGGDAWDASIRRHIKECALFVPIISANTQAREEGYFRLEWKLAVDRSYLMAEDRTFLLPVVIDDTRDADARVPEKFRDVQWTRLPAGEAAPEFATRVRQLLGAEAPPAASAPLMPRPPNRPVRRPRWWLLAAGVLALATAWVAIRAVLPTARPTSALAGAPVVAVIPLRSSTGGDDDAMAESLTRDLASALARRMTLTQVLPHDLVASHKARQLDPRSVGRELGATYLVLGEVRRPPGQLEIVAQLVDAATARQLWTGRAAAAMSAAGDDQAQMISRLTGRLAAEINSANNQRYAGAPASDASPAEFTLHGYAVWVQNNASVAGSREARTWFDKALRIDARFLPAIVGQVNALEYEMIFDPLVDASATVRAMDELSVRAISLANTHPATWQQRAQTLIWLRRWDAALEALGNAEKFAGIEGLRSDLRSELLNRIGQPQQALQEVQRGLDADPSNQEVRGWLMLQQCHAYMALGRYRESILGCERNVAVDDWWLPHLYLVAGFARTGDAVRAASERETLLRLRPSASVAEYKTLFYSDNPDFVRQAEDNLLTGLRQAGIPER